MEVPMRTIDLALKDIRQVLRDRRSLIFLMVMPILFTFFFGFSTNNQKVDTDPRLKIAVVNRDPDGLLCKALVDLLNASETVRPEMIADSDAAQIDTRIVKGELAAGLVIPQGYSADTL